MMSFFMNKITNYILRKIGPGKMPHASGILLFFVKKKGAATGS